MKLKDKAYSYPVLRNNSDDYIQGDIELDVDIENIMNEDKLKVEFNLNEQSIETLILEDKAQKIVHVECPQTLFRKTYVVNGSNKSIALSKDIIRGRVEVTGFIVAINDIKNFKSDNFNSLYGNLEFNFEKGNILAETEMFEIDLSENEQSIENLSSIITISLTHDKDLMTVDLTTEKIVIALPKKQYEQYAKYSSSIFNNILISVVVVPALVEVLNRVKNDKQSFEEDRWFISMNQTLEHIGVNLNDFDDSPLEIVQNLLRNPVQGAINVLNKIEEGAND